MTHLLDSATARPPQRGRGLLHWALVLLLLSTAVATVLTLVSDRSGTFGTNLLFSQCISVSVTLWCVALMHLPPLTTLSRLPALAVSLVAATPLGYASGYAVAATLLGLPAQPAWFEPGRRLGVVATVLASAVVAALIWVRQRLLAEAAARSEAQRLAAEAQLRLLRTQLEPHMLFNTLANLRSLVETDPPQAQRMIDQLITYLRSSLGASRSESTTLANEFAQLRAYLEIMALRMGPRMGYALLLPDALKDFGVPPMLLQPLVENAVKHGIEPKVGAGRIDIEARSVDGAVEITVSDTGLGLPPDDAPPGESTSYGLTHVRERLAAAYGARASLSLQRRSPQGVNAIVRIET
jgi:signal transduction histidine kinase